MPNMRATPTFRRRRLGKTLKQYREAADLSLRRAADLMGDAWSGGDTKMSRVENATARITPAQVLQLLEIYGVTDPEIIKAMESLAKTAGRKGWWTSFEWLRGIEDSFDDWLYAEEEASEIRQYNANAIPGLLQTAAYAQAITESTALFIPSESYGAIVDLRMKRQVTITRTENPINYTFVVHESLFRQRVDPNPLVMREQLKHLLHVSEFPNVNLLVMPLDAALSPAARGNIAILTFPGPWVPLVCMETPGVVQYLEHAEKSAQLLISFDKIVSSALSGDRSREVIQDYMKGT